MGSRTSNDLGLAHPNTLANRNNLASAYRVAGRVAEAITILQELLADYERILGPTHPSTMATRPALAGGLPSGRGRRGGGPFDGLAASESTSPNKRSGGGSVAAAVVSMGHLGRMNWAGFSRRR
ncbi:MAG: tetratricopeptide repeat protein [Solirubrobacteraceae bacterium]